MVVFVIAAAVVLAVAATRNDEPSSQALLLGLFPVIVYALPVTMYNWGASLVKRALADAAHLK